MTQTKSEYSHVADVPDIVVDPHDATGHEFLIHHMGMRFWVDCTVLRPPGRSQSVQVAIPWVITNTTGVYKGRLRVSYATTRYRWLPGPVAAQRLRKKV